jgi:hypothetical protein
MKTHRILPLHSSAGLTECSTIEHESRYSYPGMLLFYPSKLDAARLRGSLSQVLSDFPEYASKLRVSATALQIRHGAGPAVFECAQLDSTLADVMAVLRAHKRYAALEPAVRVLGVLLTLEPTLLIRLTELRDGCVLAVGWNHAIGDMHSTMLLLRAWADAYAGRPYQKPIHVYDRDAYLRAVLPDSRAVRSVARRTSLVSSIAQRLPLFQAGTQVHAELSKTQLETWRAALSGNQPISRNDALCAHVYAVLRRLSHAPQQTNLCLVVNFRKRLGLPDRLIGNMTSLIAQPVRKHHSAAQVAAGLRKRLDEYADKHVYYHPTARVFRACERVSQRLLLVSRQFRPGSGDIFITNWDNFGVYDLTFDGSPLELCHPTTLGTQLPQWFMIVYELPRGQGLGVTLALPKAVARRWQSQEGQALLHGIPYAPTRGRSTREQSASPGWPTHASPRHPRSLGS